MRLRTETALTLGVAAAAIIASSAAKAQSVDSAAQNRQSTGNSAAIVRSHVSPDEAAGGHQFVQPPFMNSNGMRTYSPPPNAENRTAPSSHGYYYYYTPPQGGYVSGGPTSTGPIAPSGYPYFATQGSMIPSRGLFPFAPQQYFGTPFQAPQNYFPYGNSVPQNSDNDDEHRSRHRGGYYDGGQTYFSSGYYFQGYCADNYGSYVYPTVYGLYIGLPGYFDAQSAPIVILPDAYQVWESGTWYNYSFDPFASSDYAANSNNGYSYGSDGSSSGAIVSSDAGASLPAGLRQSMNDIASAWASRDAGALSQHLPQSGPLSVGLNNRYAYSISPGAYQQMTRDAMQHLTTTDFRYNGVRMHPGGTATAYAEQRYIAPTGDQSKMYLAYTLRKDASQSGRYVITGVSSSTSPITGQRVPSMGESTYSNH